MKVKQLIKYLKELPQDSDVYIEYPDGNQSYFENDIYLYSDDEDDTIISTVLYKKENRGKDYVIFE